MNNDEKKFKSLKNNAQGHFFEKEVERACNYYREKNIANIHKVPEPFRVLKKLPAGKFTGQFLRKAEPDFKGCFMNGQCIVFECKYTSQSKIQRSILSENQNAELERNHNLKCITAICICFAEGLTERYFFVPFEIWLNMEKHFGKKSVTADDLKSFEIFYKHSIGIDFLKNIKIKIEKGDVK